MANSLRFSVQSGKHAKIILDFLPIWKWVHYKAMLREADSNNQFPITAFRNPFPVTARYRKPTFRIQSKTVFPSEHLYHLRPFYPTYTHSRAIMGIDLCSCQENISAVSKE
uniref:Uncharacterized protein n=1 Tax=Candidatus Kentrum sp. LFY TaxID=2126342 RepID=A0A450WN50_9GAMM|nr:MAG: hypothetical protein BECKLFY1418C_GA0070996_10448 [Candidatus Kentron sp. LFY]